jgi:hypothetical protein
LPSFPCLRAVALQRAGVKTGIQSFQYVRGYPLEFTPYLIRGRNDEIIDFMDRLYLMGRDIILVLSS